MLLSSISGLPLAPSPVSYAGLCTYFSSKLQSWIEVVLKSTWTLADMWVGVSVIYATHVLLFKALLWAVMKVDEAGRRSTPQTTPLNSNSNTTHGDAAQANTKTSNVRQVDWAQLLARDLYL